MKKCVRGSSSIPKNCLEIGLGYVGQKSILKSDGQNESDLNYLGPALYTFED